MCSDGATVFVGLLRVEIGRQEFSCKECVKSKGENGYCFKVTDTGRGTSGERAVGMIVFLCVDGVKTKKTGGGGSFCRLAWSVIYRKFSRFANSLVRTALVTLYPIWIIYQRVACQGNTSASKCCSRTILSYTRGVTLQ